MNIVILHGWGQSNKLWKSLASKFRPTKTLILDLPGFGDQKLISDSWEISDYSKWVIKEIRKRGLKDVTLVGHSFGGKVALQLIIEDSTLIKNLVLIAAPVIRRPGKLIGLKIRGYKLVKKLLPNTLSKVFSSTEYNQAKGMKMGKIFAKSVEFDRTKELAKVKTPTLIIWGEKDITTSRSIGLEMHHLIKSSTYKEIKGAGHNLHLSHENLLFGLINKFI